MTAKPERAFGSEATIPLFQLVLTVPERMRLLQLLPRLQGDIATVRSLRILAEELSFSDQEQEDFEVKYEETAVKWNAAKVAKAEPREFKFRRVIFEMIGDVLKGLSKTKTLTMDFIELHDKFVSKPASVEGA